MEDLPDRSNDETKKLELIFFRTPHFLEVEAEMVFSFKGSMMSSLLFPSFFNVYSKSLTSSVTGWAHASFIIASSWECSHLGSLQRLNEGSWEHICFSRVYKINYWLYLQYS